jgi:hypothetical protein
MAQKINKKSKNSTWRCHIGETWRFPALVLLQGVSQRIFSMQGGISKKKFTGDIPKQAYFAGVSTI